MTQRGSSVWLIAGFATAAFLLLLLWLNPDNRVAFLLGLLAGIAASLLVTVWYEYATRPEVEIIEDEKDPHRGNSPFPHAFYHMKVRQKRAKWPFTGRRPAWAARADLIVCRVDRSTRVIPEPVTGRWAGTPEPITPVERGLTFDISKLPFTERKDIHYNHPGEQLDIAVEIEGRDWYIFNSLNYTHPQWRYEPHGLQPGEYFVHVIVYYETGKAEHWKYLRIPESPPPTPAEPSSDPSGYVTPGPPPPALSSQSTDKIATSTASGPGHGGIEPLAERRRA